MTQENGVNHPKYLTELRKVFLQAIAELDTENVIGPLRSKWISERMSEMCSVLLLRYIAGQTKYGGRIEDATPIVEMYAELSDLFWYMNAALKPMKGKDPYEL